MCAEKIQDEAILCRFCGKSTDPTRPKMGAQKWLWALALLLLATSGLYIIGLQQSTSAKSRNVSNEAKGRPSPRAYSTENTSGYSVFSVDRKFNFVVAKIGLQDGIKKGDLLKVFKGGKEIATIKVEKLYDAFSASGILREDLSQRIEEGDEVRKL